NPDALRERPSICRLQQVELLEAMELLDRGDHLVQHRATKDCDLHRSRRSDIGDYLWILYDNPNYNFWKPGSWFPVIARSDLVFWGAVTDFSGAHRRIYRSAVQ